ncbi:tyrosine protein phosphatase [Tardiphaga sp.]|uniref:tyrosine phosphatase family protein n=1 Tax=Tardiphaga sp. TaxID=1926292 RepID=UPI0026048138|nr:tyrosine protein phosphatase [Tardiphaga sp.]
MCSLRGLPDVAASLEAFDLLTLMSPSAEPPDWHVFSHTRHLRLVFNDISVPTPGLIAPDAMMLQAVLDFGRDSVASRPMLIHCWAGISRSSAAAYIIACDRNPGFENDIADELRRRSAVVTPNKWMVQLADDLLGRRGVMADAIARIGRGADAFDGAPYRLPLAWPLASSNGEEESHAADALARGQVRMDAGSTQAG